MDTEQRVAQHYTREGLEQAILSGLEASGKDIGKLTASDLSAVDEFHLGWLPATIEFARELGLAKGMHVLDVGSGVGGPARYFVEAHGCRVTGIDLTEGFRAGRQRLDGTLWSRRPRNLHAGERSRAAVRAGGVRCCQSHSRRHEHPGQGKALLRSAPRAEVRRPVWRLRGHGGCRRRAPLSDAVVANA